jgi:hypothetical protein
VNRARNQRGGLAHSSTDLEVDRYDAASVITMTAMTSAGHFSDVIDKDAEVLYQVPLIRTGARWTRSSRADR